MRAYLTDLLRRRPELVPAAIEEFLRFDGPTMNATLRFAKPGLTIGGVQIPVGDLVQLSLASADHDPTHFERADELDIRRTDRPAATCSPCSCSASRRVRWRRGSARRSTW